MPVLRVGLQKREGHRPTAPGGRKPGATSYTRPAQPGRMPEHGLQADTPALPCAPSGSGNRRWNSTSGCSNCDSRVKTTSQVSRDTSQKRANHFLGPEKPFPTSGMGPAPQWGGWKRGSESTVSWASPAPARTGVTMEDTGEPGDRSRGALVSLSSGGLRANPCGNSRQAPGRRALGGLSL